MLRLAIAELIHFSCLLQILQESSLLHESMLLLIRHIDDIMIHQALLYWIIRCMAGLMVTAGLHGISLSSPRVHGDRVA